MTCRDCLNEVCGAYRCEHLMDKENAEKECPSFKNKADFVEVAEITQKIDFAIEATNENSDYDVGLRNGLRLAMSFIDGKQPQYERRDT